MIMKYNGNLLIGSLFREINYNLKLEYCLIPNAKHLLLCFDFVTLCSFSTLCDSSSMCISSITISCCNP